jgi:hypothetical protein
MYLFLNAYTDSQLVVRLNRQYPKFDESLWFEWSSGRIFNFTRTEHAESGNIR